MSKPRCENCGNRTETWQSATHGSYEHCPFCNLDQKPDPLVGTCLTHDLGTEHYKTDRCEDWEALSPQTKPQESTKDPLPSEPKEAKPADCQQCKGTGKYKAHITTTNNPTGWDATYTCNHQIHTYGEAIASVNSMETMSDSMSTKAGECRANALSNSLPGARQEPAQPNSTDTEIKSMLLYNAKHIGLVGKDMKMLYINAPMLIEQIQDYVAQAVREGKIEELDWLEQNGHGGGNFRRLIIQAIARIQALEKGEE